MKNNIIIAGVPRAGKSTISHRLAKQYGYQHISMDSIIAGFEKCFPETGVNTYAGLSSADTLRLISGKMAPFVRAMLDSGEYDEFEPGVVLDMYQLLPEDYMKYIPFTNRMKNFGKAQCILWSKASVSKTSVKSTVCHTLRLQGTGNEYFNAFYKISTFNNQRTIFCFHQRAVFNSFDHLTKANKCSENVL